MIMPVPFRRRYWNATRARLTSLGFTIVQDGDHEGAAAFDPANPQLAELAMRAAGIKKKRKLSREQREKLIARLRPFRGEPLSAPETAVGVRGYIELSSNQEGAVRVLPQAKQDDTGGVR
jgi:hypothetical protein